MMALALVGPPTAARAAAGTVNTTAQGLQTDVTLLGLQLANATTPPVAWQSGDAAKTNNTANVNGSGLGLKTQAVNVAAQPSGAVGGNAFAEVAGLGLTLAGSDIGGNLIRSQCEMTPTSISAAATSTGLKLGTQNVDPNAAANTTLNVAGVATAIVNKQTATYNSTSGRLTHTIQGLNLQLLGGTLSAVGNGTIEVAESTCSGIVKFGSITTDAATVTPGLEGTATVTIANVGDIAAPNTVVTIPAPPSAYTLGTVTNDGGGTCDVTSSQIRCSGITVPGSGSAKISLPVALGPGGANAPDWAPGTDQITAVSTPVAALPDTTITVRGQGTLARAGSPRTTGGSIEIMPMTVGVGKSASTPITIGNDGPSNATTTVTIPFTGQPAGVSITGATIGSNTCAVNASNVVCSNVAVPAKGETQINVTAAATAQATIGATWDLSNVTATLNGFAVTGNGRLLTVSDPDVNLNGGVLIVPTTGVPGGPSARFEVRVTNSGMVSGGNTTITIPAPPAGYTVGTITTSGGGSCSASANSILCTGVTVPAGGTVTIRVDVTLAASVTTDWRATVSAPVSATSGDSIGQATGPIVTVAADYTLVADVAGPNPGTVRPGQESTVTVTLRNDGPSDAPTARFYVRTPDQTTIKLPLDVVTAGLCQTAGPTNLTCTADLDAGDSVVFTLTFVVSESASGPLSGGCLSLDGNTACGGAKDRPLPVIQLEAALNKRVVVTLDKATVTPGEGGDGTLLIMSSRDETSISVTIPTGGLPGGFRITRVRVTTPAGSCQVGSNAITCTGLRLSAGVEYQILITVTIGSDIVPPVVWTVTDIQISDGEEQFTVGGDLVVTGAPVIDLRADIDGPADDTVSPGGKATVTVTITNQGPSDARDYVFVVLAPTNTTFDTLGADVAQYCSVVSAGRLSCKVSLRVGISLRLVFVVVIPASADPGEPVDGGCVDFDGQTGCGPEDYAWPAIVLQASFDRRVSVETTAAEVTPGRNDVATISVTATRGALNGLSVTVPLQGIPVGVTVTAYTSTGGGQCSATGTQVSCTGINVADGASVVISLTITVASSVQQGVTWDVNGIVIALGSQSVSVRGRLLIVTAAQYVLDVDVTPPAGPLDPGGGGDITIVIDNRGPSDVFRKEISILAPDGGGFGPLTGPASGFCRLVAADRAVCTIDITVDGGPLTFGMPLVVSTGADPDRPLDGGCVDLNDNGLCDGDDVLMPAIELSAQFERIVDISTVPVQITPGLLGAARVQLTASPAQQDLTVTIPLDDKPAEMTVVLANMQPMDLCQQQGNAIVCTGVDVPSTGVTTINIPVLVSVTAGPMVWATRAIVATNAAGKRAIGAGLLVRVGDPQYTLDATVVGPQAGTVLPGDTTTMRITVTNSGPSAVSNGLVTIHAPVGTSFGAVGSPLSDSCRRESSELITCYVNLAVGAQLVWDVLIAVPGNVDRYQQTITGGCIDLNGDGGCGGAGDRYLPDIVLAQQLRRLVTLTGTNSPIVPGTTATTTVTVALSQARSDIRIIIPRTGLPAGVVTTGVAASGASCTTSATEYSCGLFTIQAGGQVTVQVSVTATSAAMPSSVWAPRISVVRGPETVTRTVTVLTVGDADAPLTVTVVPPDPGLLVPGGSGDLQITITNPGPSDARNARFLFRSPTGTTFGALNAQVSQFCTRLSAYTVDCYVSVAASSSLRFALTIVVPPTADPDDPITGGCVDTNRDGACTSPPDSPFPDIELGSTLGNVVSRVATQVGSVTPGLSGSGYVAVTARRAATGLGITVPTTTLPAGLTITGASGPSGSACVVQTAQIACTGVNVASGVNQAVAISVRAAATVATGTIWSADPITVTTGDEVVQGSGQLITVGGTQTGVTVTSTGPTTSVLPGDSTTLTWTMVNNGPSASVDQAVTVVAPSQTTFGTLSGAAANDCTVASTTRLTCRLNLAVSGTRTYAILVVVNADATENSTATGGCLTLGGSQYCVPDFEIGAERASGLPLSTRATLTLGSKVIEAGESGNPTIRAVTTSDYEDLTLAVPLGALPDGFTVSAANSTAGTCAVTTARAACTGITTVADEAVTMTLTVAVAGSVSDAATWSPTVTLSETDAPTNTKTAQGTLVTTSADTDLTSTSFGTYTVNPAAPGQRTVLAVRLSNPGPGSAIGHLTTVRLPNGLTAASTPSDCDYDDADNVLVCTRDVDAGASTTYNLPLVVGTSVKAGTSITGGCVDAEPADGSCGGDADLAMPSLSVTSPKVDLELGVKRKNTTAARGGTVLVKFPYSNNGSQTAAGVSFTIDPPDGVTVAKARILLDSSESSEAGLVDADCEASDEGDSNTVVCRGPDAAVGTASELWLSLRIASNAPKGVKPVRVTISTYSAEGNIVNNTVEALLSIGTGDTMPTDNSDRGNGGWDNLPKTGQNLVGLLILSLLLVIGGVLLRSGARPRK